MNQEQLQIIKDELTADPLQRGYAAMSDESAANSLMQQNRTVDRENLSSGLLVSCLDKTEIGRAHV